MKRPCALVLLAIVGAASDLIACGEESVSGFDRLSRTAISPKFDLAEYPKEMVSAVQAHSSYVMGIDVAPNGKSLVSCSLDGSLKLWSLGGAVPRQSKLLAEGLDRLLWVALSSDGRRLATGGHDGILHLWDWADGEVPSKQADIGPLADTVWSGSWGSIDRLSYSIGTALEMHALNKRSAKEPVRVVVTEKNVAKVSNSVTVAMSSDGNILAAATTDGTLRVWSVEKDALNEILRTEENSWVQVLAVSPNGRFVASCSDGYAVDIWSLAHMPPKKTTVLDRRTGFLEAVAFSPKGKLLASADRSGRVCIWDVAKRDKRHEFKLPDKVISLAFASAERHLVVGTAKGQICALRLTPKLVNNGRPKQ